MGGWGSGLGVDDFGDADLAEGAVGGVTEQVGLFEAGSGLILTEAVEDRGRMGGGFDSIDIDVGQRLDVTKDGVKLPLEGFTFLIAKIDTCEVGHVADIHMLTAHAGKLNGGEGKFKH